MSSSTSRSPLAAPAPAPVSRVLLILNTHMPQVLGRGALFDEPENWLFEALTETYIPLFRLLEQGGARHFPGRLILSFTPCLLDQLEACGERYVAYLRILHRIASFELERTSSLAAYNRFEKYAQALSHEELRLLHHTAEEYLRRVEDSLEFVSTQDMGTRFRALAATAADNLELWTSSPQHNYLPFFTEAVADRFVARGVESFEQRFGRRPDGFWLPECAFRPGLERLLSRHGVARTSLSLHGIGAIQPTDTSGVYRCGDLSVLVHDHRIAMQLWKAPEETLPAHPLYREFFRDLGLDVVPEYFTHLGIEVPPHRRGHLWTGIKYHAVSGTDVSLGYKRIYDTEAAREQARRHVPEFWRLLEKNRHLVHDQETFVLAFDTELFGHWWHEGMWWLEEVLKARAAPPAAREPEAVLPAVPRLFYSTWGKDFYSEHWLIRDNCWMYALVKLVEANMEGVTDPDLLRRFERLAGSDHLFLYPDPSQQALAREVFLRLFAELTEHLPLTRTEILAAFPVDPFKCLFVHVEPEREGPSPAFHVRRRPPEGRQTRLREVTLEPEVHTVAGYRIHYQYFLLQPEASYTLSLDGVADTCGIRMPDFGVPMYISGQKQVLPKYDLDKLYRKLGEIWEGGDELPVLERPPRHSQHIYTRAALEPLLAGRKTAVFKYNKEGYALLRFRELALAPPVVIFDDTIAAGEAAAFLDVRDTSVPVSNRLEDIERLPYDALVLTCSLNFESEIAYVRRLLAEAVRRRIPVISLYDDMLYYDLVPEEADTSLFYRVAVAAEEAEAATPPEHYAPANTLGVFGTDTVQGKFTTQIYLREALRSHLRVTHLSTEPTGILLGADEGYSRVARVDSAQRLVFERRRMLALAERSDLVITGGQNALLFEPRGADRASNASTLIYETFLPRLIVLTVSVETRPEVVTETISYLRTLAERHGVPCQVVGLAMLGGRKLHGSRWTETYFTGVRQEVREEARRTLERETGLPVYSVPEEVRELAQAVLRSPR